MILNNIKNMKKDRGFTIVELLVVIVVIGILAAITIVSYTGVTTRAKTAQAQSNAQSAQSVAEAYNADNGSYPDTIAHFTAGSTSSKLPAGMSVVAGLAGAVVPITGTDPLSASTGQTTVTWACLTSCTTPTGGRITYWNYSLATPSSLTAASIVYVGAGTSSGTYVVPS